MKKRLLLLSSALSVLISLPTYALDRITHGVFFDGQLGWARINETVKNIDRKEMDGFTYNAAVGYRFNHFWALETGYYNLPNDSFQYGVKGHNSQAYAADIKAIIPYDNGFNIIGKVGIAASQHELSPDYVAGFGPVKQSGDYTRQVMLLGLGFSYSLTDHLDLALQGTGLSHNGPVPAAIMVTTGLTYTI